MSSYVAALAPRVFVGPSMLDALFLLAGAAFFLVTAAYAGGCDRL